MERKIRFGEIQKADDGKLIFTISAATKDRHNTVLNQENWNLTNYNKNPIVGYQHNVYGSWFGDDNPDYVIGTSRVWNEDGLLKAEPQFEPADINPLADKIRKKIEFGSLRSTSVGFYPIEKKGKEGYWGEKDEARDGDNPTFYYYGQELLEWSVVNIPSNPDAIKNSMPDEKVDLLKEMITQALGAKYKDDIEKLTIKGLFNILRGKDAEDIMKGEGLECDFDLMKMKINLLQKL